MKYRWFWKYVVKGKGKKGLEERLEASEKRQCYKAIFRRKGRDLISKRQKERLPNES